MKVFLCAVVTVVVVATASQTLVTRLAGQTSEEAYAASSARPHEGLPR